MMSPGRTTPFSNASPTKNLNKPGSSSNREWISEVKSEISVNNQRLAYLRSLDDAREQQ